MTEWWESTIVGVLAGGAIATAAQVLVQRLSRNDEVKAERDLLVGSSRLLRDDMRAVQVRIAFAVDSGSWWRLEDLPPQLHDADDVRRLASAVPESARWGAVVTGRRTLLRLVARRGANLPFVSEDLAKNFWELEWSRRVLALDVEKTGLALNDWAPLIARNHPDLTPAWAGDVPDKPTPWRDRTKPRRED